MASRLRNGDDLHVSRQSHSLEIQSQSSAVFLFGGNPSTLECDRQFGAAEQYSSDWSASSTW